MALPVQVRTVLEYWTKSIADFGMRIAEFKISPFFELYNCNPKSEISNPKCDDSSRLPQGGKTIDAPSGGRAKPGPLGPDSLL